MTEQRNPINERIIALMKKKMTGREIAEVLNAEGYKTAHNLPFTENIVTSKIFRIRNAASDRPTKTQEPIVSPLDRAIETRIIDHKGISDRVKIELIRALRSVEKG